jgi:Poxvirus Late Transcription Factor VLTF3 like
MSKPNLKMLEYGNQVNKYLNANLTIKKPKYECELCQGYLTTTDWAPTCTECGAVHEHFMSFKKEYDIYSPPKKVCYKQMNHLLEQVKKKHRIILDYKQETRLKHLFSCILDSYEKFKGARKNMLNYEFILNKIFLCLNLPEISKKFKLLKSKKKLDEHENIWNYIKQELTSQKLL